MSEGGAVDWGGRAAASRSSKAEAEYRTSPLASRPSWKGSYTSDSGYCGPMLKLDHPDDAGLAKLQHEEQKRIELAMGYELAA
eukprot:5423663-Prymnesium_polylepis.2